jgi:hypothetical protein
MLLGVFIMLILASPQYMKFSRSQITGSLVLLAVIVLYALLRAYVFR